jgi:hypothetical protein
MERIIGSLAIELREPDGTVVLRRTARNSVMRGGAELIADLFRGTAATNPDASPALTRFAIPLAPDATSVTVLEDALKVRVRVRGLVPADFAQNADTTQTSVAIGEAALGVLAADGASLARLYNRVVFEPIQKEQDQEIALYWDIDFPFGS